jgi:hypothetical protein
VLLLPAMLVAALLQTTAGGGGVASPPASSSSPRVPAVIVFGDSTVDTGNNNVIPTPLRADFPPYGRDMPGGPRATGRFGNGRLPPDLISEALGLPPLVPAYLDPAYGIDDFARGVCFASAGTGIDNATAGVLVIVYVLLRCVTSSRITAEFIAPLAAPRAEAERARARRHGLDRSRSEAEVSSSSAQARTRPVRGAQCTGTRRTPPFWEKAHRTPPFPETKHIEFAPACAVFSRPDGDRIYRILEFLTP